MVVSHGLGRSSVVGQNLVGELAGSFMEIFVTRHNGRFDGTVNYVVRYNLDASLLVATRYNFTQASQ